jgi:hypothetical protein
MCNPCFIVESLRLESNLEFSSSDVDDEETIEDKNLIDHRIQFYNRVHDIYTNERIFRKDLIMQLCAEQWPAQQSPTKKKRTREDE